MVFPSGSGVLEKIFKKSWFLEVAIWYCKYFPMVDFKLSAVMSSTGSWEASSSSVNTIALVFPTPMQQTSRALKKMYQSNYEGVSFSIYCLYF
jgi:hypothetical protein